MTKEGERLIKSLQNEPVKYARLIGMDLLTDLHNDWIRAMAFGEEDDTLLAHRGSYKTTCLAFAIPLIMILFPSDNIIFLRKTDDDVTEVIRQVAKTLRSEPFFYIVREIYETDLVVTDSAFKVDTNLFVSAHGTPQLLGMGIGASLTGKHADILFTDDIVNLRDRTSRAERERTKLQYMELQNIRNRDGRIFNTGTPWHKEDAISLMPNVHKHDCYSTGLISKDKLKELRRSMSPALFAANYELKHIADAESMFTEPQFASRREDIFGGAAHIDAAYGGSDYTAFTVLKHVPGGIIGYGKLWHKHVDDCLPEIQRIHMDLQAGSIACETNGDKGYLAKELSGMGFLVRKYAEHMNKFVKISTYLRREWSRIYWIDDTDPEYLAQILDYTEFADHDDAADSAASLIRQMEQKDKVKIKTFSGGI